MQVIDNWVDEVDKWQLGSSVFVVRPEDAVKKRVGELRRWQHEGGLALIGFEVDPDPAPAPAPPSRRGVVLFWVCIASVQ